MIRQIGEEKIELLAEGRRMRARGRAAAGDWVALDGDAVRVVAPYRSARPFPDLTSETFRLAERLQGLRARDAILRSVRRFFWDAGFLEVETPLLVPSPGLELHLDAMRAEPGGWLITSPEYQIKGLLEASVGHVVQVGK